MNDEKLLAYLQQIILDIADTIGEKDLTEEQAQRELTKQIEILLRRFNVMAEEIIPPLIIQNYFGSLDEATALLASAGVNVSTVAAVGVGGAIAKEFRTPLHLNAVEQLLDDTLGDLQAAVRTAQASAITTINETIAEVKDELTKGTILGEPRKVMQARVAKAFREGGLTSFTTSDNRELPLDFYAMTVTRTKTREAAMQGSVNRYAEAEQDLVEIVENSDTCPICGKYKGLVVSLSGSTEGYPKVGDNGIRLPPYHPNCRGTIRPYVARFKTEDELKQAEERNAKYDPDKDTRTPAQKKAYAEEQRKRRIANAEKKQFIAWQAAMGADVPKTLGAFRRMKRSNSPKFQELQSNYRSLMQTNK